MTYRFLTSMVIGLVVVVPTAYAGWQVACHRSLVPVRMIAWWVTHVAVPLIRSPSWGRRAVTIFLNNAAVLALVLALGRWKVGGYSGVAALGLSMGIGLRILSGAEDCIAVPGSKSGRAVRSRVAIGVALNMLEPPAIAIVLGLAIGQQAIPVASTHAWALYLTYVVPALFVAAGGEALWLGEARSADRTL